MKAETFAVGLVTPDQAFTALLRLPATLRFQRMNAPIRQRVVR